MPTTPTIFAPVHSYIEPAEGARCNNRFERAIHPDEVIATLAERQLGRVARRQLLAAGISRKEIESRIHSGHLLVERPGVYAVGHRSGGWRGRAMSAVLSCGAGAVLSSLTAAAHWGLIRWQPQVFDVTVRRQVRPRPGIRLHRRKLPHDEMTFQGQLPVTTVARTLFDMASVLDVHRLDRAFNEAEVLGLVGELSVPSLMQRHPGMPGASRLREVLALGRTARTLSGLEDLFVALARDHGLPLPELNAYVELSSGPIYVDALWRESRLVVELDGGRFHGTSRRRREDRQRDHALANAGFEVMRVGDEELTGQDQGVVDAIYRRVAVRLRA